MRIKNFHIENIRNLELAEASNLPDLITLCGPNGCGKSSILEALMAAKQALGSIGGQQLAHLSLLAAGKNTAKISFTLEYQENDKIFLKTTMGTEPPDEDEIVFELVRRDNGAPRMNSLKKSGYAKHLFTHYSSEETSDHGHFDYLEAHRNKPRSPVKQWNADILNDSSTQSVFEALGGAKYALIKHYIVALHLSFLLAKQRAEKAGLPAPKDTLEDVGNFFDEFFRPMTFDGVLESQGEFIVAINTPSGTIDIDDLSAGEKEILLAYVHFHRTRPKESIILFDEVDAHLHPELQRRYFRVLKQIARGNQLWLSTHSPEMLMEAGAESLFTILKEPTGHNQFIQVSTEEETHAALTELMGQRGFISFCKKVVFVEGNYASADIAIFEKYYPSETHDIRFVPCGNSHTVSTIASVKQLLETASPFQKYFCIVDGDGMGKYDADETNNIFRLPVYHVENFLLDEELIFSVTKSIMSTKCPFGSPAETLEALKSLVVSKRQVDDYARFLHQLPEPTGCEEALQLLQEAINADNWKSKCIGRSLLKEYCSVHLNMKYESFRNLLVSDLDHPPEGLRDIMESILEA